MTWEQANIEWDNSRMTLDELRDVAVATLRGYELGDALDDIEALMAVGEE